jgi:hypothetical protein
MGDLGRPRRPALRVPGILAGVGLLRNARYRANGVRQQRRDDDQNLHGVSRGLRKLSAGNGEAGEVWRREAELPTKTRV